MPISQCLFSRRYLCAPWLQLHLALVKQTFDMRHAQEERSSTRTLWSSRDNIVTASMPYSIHRSGLLPMGKPRQAIALEVCYQNSRPTFFPFSVSNPKSIPLLSLYRVRFTTQVIFAAFVLMSQHCRLDFSSIVTRSSFFTYNDPS